MGSRMSRLDSTVTEQAKSQKKGIEKRQAQGLNPLSDDQILNAQKNTKEQRFRDIGLVNVKNADDNFKRRTGIGGNINKDLESRYQKLTATPQYSESTNALRAQMALRKSRQTSTRLGG